MKDVAEARIKERSYSGRAKTAREYVVESILHPSRHIPVGYADDIMPKVYGTKLTPLAVEKMVDYLLQLS